MAVKWTKEQEKVIRLRDRNILVSAAAGSGKTAVLVQRILNKVTDKENPVDIDRLLIMTFTRAAAGEMKERICRALENALYEDPDNEHLQRQMTLIHTAQITTIDGFCSYIIRNYFHLIGLDPGYRIADEGELKLIKEDVLDELLEDYCKEHKERFTNFMECYAPGKNDDGVRELILQVYNAAMSNPYPEEWLEKCLNSYKISDIDGIKQSEWFQLLWKNAKEELGEAVNLAREGKNLCVMPEGPYLYEEAFDSDLLLLFRMMASIDEMDYDKTSELLRKPSFARLSTKKPKEPVNDRLKEQAKALRDQEKETVKEVSSRYFQNTMEELLEGIQASRGPMEMLAELTREFIKRLAQKKREKNLLDFTDMEHFALDILMSKKDDTIIPSQAARELSLKYDEVLVDEYQDSNLVQELLTNCVSGWINDRKNIFMVGDVKQSIYRFRLARPELFMEKYKNYSLEDSPQQRIDLHKNFRSRGQVLESVNFIFRQVMGEDLGGVTYDDAAALYPGAVFPQGANEDFIKTEVLLVEKDTEESEDESALENDREMEALAIAHKIRDMVGREMVVDKETGEYRPVQYGDIVVLLRTASGWAETFGEVFSSQGIPSYTASKTGYFSALEVVTVLNFLRVCDNPRQDIPLTGVLRSPVAGCSAQELAMVRVAFPEGMLYDSLLAYIQPEFAAVSEEEQRLKRKLTKFRKLLGKIRDKSAYTPVHQLILDVLECTGYGNYARALPDGEQRSANLSMLVEKAMDYEKTSYRGLFNFVRYIEHLQKYEVDYGEVNLSGAGEGSVQIMTIHKSKGLEFPVVFAAGMGKQFNFQDMNARLLIHPQFGFGADAILSERRIVVSSLNKQIIRRVLLKESLGEELRVLYVALTRAREKLILTGTVGKLEKRLLSLARFTGSEELLLPIGVRLKAKCYWDYVLPALSRNPGMDPIFMEYKVPPKLKNPIRNMEGEFLVKRLTVKELTEDEVLYQTGAQIQEEILRNWDSRRVFDRSIHEEIKKRFEFVYPYDYLKEIPVKVSISELKKKSYREEFEIQEKAAGEEELQPLVPHFIEKKEEEYKGALRGTAYHRVMECLDYGRADTKEEISRQLESLVQEQKLLKEEAQCVRIRDIERFLKASVGRRMKKAANSGMLFREQPFMIASRASDLEEGWPKDETVLVQGIIDAFFMEDEDIVLVDYKTDRVKEGEEDLLALRYRIQLMDYAAALERMTGRRVKERIIYSFTLGKEIGVL